MKIEEAVTAIEGCGKQTELNDTLQLIVENCGFASYCFLDTGAPHIDVPYYTGTTGEAWEREYETNGFVHVDACIQQARRTNLPFSWGEVPFPNRRRGYKPGALQTMEASADHGFKQGLVVPFHFADDVGRVHSSVCTLFWMDNASEFREMTLLKGQELHLLLIYWMQRSIDVRMDESSGERLSRVDRIGRINKGVWLTDRERDVISWAARGKTAGETADILSISSETVVSHIKNATIKLKAGNKTHAVAKSVVLGLIDL